MSMFHHTITTVMTVDSKWELQAQHASLNSGVAERFITEPILENRNTVQHCIKLCKTVMMYVNFNCFVYWQPATHELMLILLLAPGWAERQLLGQLLPFVTAAC